MFFYAGNEDYNHYNEVGIIVNQDKRDDQGFCFNIRQSNFTATECTIIWRKYYLDLLELFYEQLYWAM